MKRTLPPVMLLPAPRLAVLLAVLFCLGAGFATWLVSRYIINSDKTIPSNHNTLFILLFAALGLFLLLVWRESKNSAAISRIEFLSSFTLVLQLKGQTCEAQWLAYQRAGPVGWLRLRLRDAPLGDRGCTVFLLGNFATSAAMRRWLTLRSLNSSVNPPELAQTDLAAHAAARRA